MSSIFVCRPNMFFLSRASPTLCRYACILYDIIPELERSLINYAFAECNASSTPFGFRINYIWFCGCESIARTILLIRLKKSPVRSSIIWYLIPNYYTMYCCKWYSACNGVEHWCWMNVKSLSKENISISHRATICTLVSLCCSGMSAHSWTICFQPRLRTTCITTPNIWLCFTYWNMPYWAIHNLVLAARSAS